MDKKIYVRITSNHCDYYGNIYRRGYIVKAFGGWDLYGYTMSGDKNDPTCGIVHLGHLTEYAKPTGIFSRITAL